jgi:hypothetical protein
MRRSTETMLMARTCLSRIRTRQEMACVKARAHCSNLLQKSLLYLWYCRPCTPAHTHLCVCSPQANLSRTTATVNTARKRMRVLWRNKKQWYTCRGALPIRSTAQIAPCAEEGSRAQRDGRLLIWVTQQTQSCSFTLAVMYKHLDMYKYIFWRY